MAALDKSKFNKKYSKLIDDFNKLPINSDIEYTVTPQTSKSIHDAFAALRSFVYGGAREVFGDVGISEVVVTDFTMLCLVQNQDKTFALQPLVLKTEGSIPFDTQDDTTPIQTKTLLEIKAKLHELSKPWYKKLFGIK